MRYRLQPYRLPDPGGTSVKTVPVIVLLGLLPPRLGWPGIVTHAHDNRDGLTRPLAQIAGERRKTAAMPTDLYTIHPDGGIIVSSLEVQEHTLTRPFLRHLKRTTVPDRQHKITVTNTREGRFGTEWHDD